MPQHFLTRQINAGGTSFARALLSASCRRPPASDRCTPFSDIDEPPPSASSAPILGKLAPAALGGNRHTQAPVQNGASRPTATIDIRLQNESV
jgi:hypothetical protein